MENIEIKIDRTKLESLLREAAKAMFEHKFSGWGIHTLYDLDNGSLANGDCVSISTTYQKNVLTLAYTERWEISDEDENNACDNHECRSWKLLNENDGDGLKDVEYCDECRDAYIDDYVDAVIEELTEKGIEESGIAYEVELC